MITQILTKQQTDIAAKIIRAGGVVALPTETVYGLCANALNSDAVKKIFKAKGRPNDNPLIVHISEFDQIYNLVDKIPQKAKKLIDTFWPGPLTVVLPGKNTVPNIVTANLNTIAIRLPSHPIIREVIKLSKVPIAAPSANISGKPSPTKFSHVLNDMNGKIEAILDGGDCSVGLESTVISFDSDIPKLLRPGKITVEQIENLIGKIEIDDAVTKGIRLDQIVSSPGMKYKHYAPNAKIIILDCDRQKYIDYVNSKASPEIAALCYEGDKNDLNVTSIAYGKENEYEMMANLFFNALRKIDTMENIKTVYARCPSPKGLGLALYNRLIRAAGFEVQKIE